MYRFTDHVGGTIEKSHEFITIYLYSSGGSSNFEIGGVSRRGRIFGVRFTYILVLVRRVENKIHILYPLLFHYNKKICMLCSQILQQQIQCFFKLVAVPVLDPPLALYEKEPPQIKKKCLIHPWSGHIQCDIKNENIDIFEYIHLIMSILQT